MSPQADPATAAGTGMTPDQAEDIATGRTTVLDTFERFLADDRDEIAVLDDEGRRWTRAELGQQSDRFAELLRSEGLEAGDTVVICLPNRVEWMAAYLGVLKVGAVPGTLPVTLDVVSVGDAMRQIGAVIVALPASHGRRDFVSELDVLARHLGSAFTAVLLDAGSGSLSVTRRDGEPLPAVELPQGTAHILFSSSTTGASKAIAHSHASLSAYNLGIISRYGVRAPGAIFMPSPLGHSTGVWHGARMALLTGCRLVLQDRWDPQVALRLVEENGAQITVAATPFLRDLVDARWDGPGVKLQSLQAFICGGAQVPPSLLDQAATELPNTFVGNVWAMSEGGATCSTLTDSREQVLNTCGLALPGTELQVIDLQGNPVAAGVEGELVMRTRSQCLGYVGQRDLFEACFTDDGFFRTGDLGVIDGRGYMRITGRTKDLIIRGGVNIAPVGIENVLVGHPDIAEVAVIGMPDPRMGERICAAVVPVGGRQVDLDGLTSWLAGTDLPKRYWPEAVVTVSALPATPAGKVRKAVLAEELFGDAGDRAPQ